MTKKSKPKTTNPIIHLYVAELESENAKLQAKIAKIEVQNISYKNRISALEKEMKNAKYQPHNKTLDLPIRERIKLLRKVEDEDKNTA